jgi:hypothetical protein
MIDGTGVDLFWPIEVGRGMERVHTGIGPSGARQSNPARAAD